jgi:glycyl-tRNA synthetase beta chain
VVDSEGRLLPAFLAVTNTQGTTPRVIAVNAERVVTARLRDARFFWDADRKVGLENRLPRLETLVFHKALGSYRAKAERVASLARWIASDVCGASAEVAGHAEQAGRLAKADLATDMVREFTELQGVMGGIYAREAGAPEAVWKAIYHHYEPISVDAGAAPAVAQLNGAGLTWAAVSLADKLDTIAGLFHAGERPTGSRDPFGLRRAAHGVIRILLDLAPLTGVSARPQLLSLLKHAVKGYAAEGADPAAHVMAEEAWQDVTAFMRERVEYVLNARGADRRNVRAVLAAGIERPLADLEANVKALPAVAATESFRQLATAFKRVRNIAREWPDGAAEHADLKQVLVEPAELALLAELEAREATIQQAVANGDGYAQAYQEAARFEPAVAKFFTDVFVMAEDPALRQARLQVMKRLERLVLQLGDISEIVAE